MRREDAYAIAAFLGAAYWQGKAMPAETAKLYAAALEKLPVDPVRRFVEEWVEGDLRGFAPTIGQIVGGVRARLEASRPAPRGLPPGSWVRKAPWYVRLQVARQQAGEPAGQPLEEVRERRQEILDECARRGIQVSPLQQELASPEVRR